MSIPGMTNTYIGARYVPILDGPWDATKNYEPLIMVTNQGATYLSKTYVPAGTPLTNENFWILSANYNAQFAQLQSQVEQYQTQVNQLEQSLSFIKNNVFTAGVYGDYVLESQQVSITSQSIQNGQNVSLSFTGNTAAPGTRFVGSVNITAVDTRVGIINFRMIEEQRSVILNQGVEAYLSNNCGTPIALCSLITAITGIARCYTSVSGGINTTFKLNFHGLFS